MTDGREGILDDGRPARQHLRWPMVVANVLLVIAILGLLAATWMPAIYDHFATTMPAP